MSKILCLVYSAVFLLIGCDSQLQSESKQDWNSDPKIIDYNVSDVLPPLENSHPAVRSYITSLYKNLERNKQHQQTLLIFADALFANHFYLHANTAYKILSNSTFPRHKSQVMLAVTLYRLGRMDEAIKQIQVANQIQTIDSSKNVELYSFYFEGRLLEENGEYTTADRS